MKIKRILSLVIVGVMLLASMTAFAAENEVKIELSKFVYAPNERLHVKISGLTEQQIADGAIAQVAESRFADYRSGTYVKVAEPKVFGDSASVDLWAKDGVDYFASKDIIKGDGTNFLPLDNCVCEEAIVLVKRICDSYAK